MSVDLLSIDPMWLRRLSVGNAAHYFCKAARGEAATDDQQNIYFAGSVTGGRDDQPLYEEIIRMLSSYGYVLTRHVGHARLTALGEQDHKSCAIYDRNMRWLAQSKAMVAETTVPSFGVGYEVAKAEGLGIPILCLYRESPDRRLTAMADGNPFLRVVKYRDLADLEDCLRVFFEAVRLTAIWRRSSL